MIPLVLSKEKVIKHSIIWTVITVYFVLVDSFKGKVEANVVGLAMIVFSYIFSYYFLSLFILEKYRAYPSKFILGLLLTLIIFCSIILTTNYILVPVLGGKSITQQRPLWESTLSTIVSFFITALAAYAFYNHNLSIKKLKSQSKKEKLAILKDLVFLRSQFHSKFTFDFINYCHLKVERSSNDAANAINLFSKLLDYSLSVKPNEQVELQREITFIKDYIALQKILNTHLFININCKGALNERYITSRILITFVENAIKHGITNDHLNPIYINLTSENGVIHFSVENKKNMNSKFIKTGIGHQNVKQYLELFYPKSYALEIKNSMESYLCDLKLLV